MQGSKIKKRSGRVFPNGSGFLSFGEYEVPCFLFYWSIVI